MHQTPQVCPFYNNNCVEDSPKNINCKLNYAECLYYAPLYLIQATYQIPLTCPFEDECEKCKHEISHITHNSDYRECPIFSSKFWTQTTHKKE